MPAILLLDAERVNLFSVPVSAEDPGEAVPVGMAVAELAAAPCQALTLPEVESRCSR